MTFNARFISRHVGMDRWVILDGGAVNTKVMAIGAGRHQDEGKEERHHPDQPFTTRFQV
jgi:hypothetical protein